MYVDCSTHDELIGFDVRRVVMYVLRQRKRVNNITQRFDLVTYRLSFYNGPPQRVGLSKVQRGKMQ